MNSDRRSTEDNL